MCKGKKLFLSHLEGSVGTARSEGLSASSRAGFVIPSPQPSSHLHCDPVMTSRRVSPALGRLSGLGKFT